MTATAEQWRRAIVDQVANVMTIARAAYTLETAHSMRDTLVALRGIALAVGDRELDSLIGHAVKEADQIAARIATSYSRRWRR